MVYHAVKQRYVGSKLIKKFGFSFVLPSRLTRRDYMSIRFEKFKIMQLAFVGGTESCEYLVIIYSVVQINFDISGWVGSHRT